MENEHNNTDKPLYEYRFDDKGGAFITRYYGHEENVVIPSEFEGKPVVYIGYNSFADCKFLKSVVIPDGVKKIAWRAFYDCHALETVTIPDSVTEIVSDAFSGCAQYGKALFSTSGKFLLDVDEHFSGELVIPPGTIMAVEDSVRNCRDITSVVIPDSLTEIKPGTFWDCNAIKTWKVSENHPTYKAFGGCLMTKDEKTLVMYPAAVGEYQIPQGVTKIEDLAFRGCYTLTSVVIPDSVTTIGMGAFWSCCSLKSVNIPKSVTYIDSYAFCECDSLTSVEIPDSVKEMGERVFYYCTSLKSAVIHEGIIKIEDGTFSDCYSLESVILPESVMFIGDMAFEECSDVILYIPQWSYIKHEAQEQNIKFEILKSEGVTFISGTKQE